MVIIGSTIFIVVESIIVVVPVTLKLPSIDKSPPIVKWPITAVVDAAALDPPVIDKHSAATTALQAVWNEILPNSPPEVTSTACETILTYSISDVGSYTEPSTLLFWPLNKIRPNVSLSATCSPAVTVSPFVFIKLLNSISPK